MCGGRPVDKYVCQLLICGLLDCNAYFTVTNRALNIKYIREARAINLNLETFLLTTVAQHTCHWLESGKMYAVSPGNVCHDGIFLEVTTCSVFS